MEVALLVPGIPTLLVDPAPLVVVLPNVVSVAPAPYLSSSNGSSR